MNNQIQRKDSTKVPESTLYRLPWCLSNVKLLKQKGERYVSSTQISKEININASRIVRDLSYVNISGRTRVGYKVDALIVVLEDFLGFMSMHKAFLFGVGSPRGALLCDSGLSHSSLEIVTTFDANPTLVGATFNGIPTFRSDDFQEEMEEYDAHIGVLTVSTKITQCIADATIAGGIKAVWDLAPFRIRAPGDTVVQNTLLYAHLAVIFNRLNFSETEQIMKIIVVRMNYIRHDEELGHALGNEEPVIFMRPDSVILEDGKPFFIPDFLNEVHYETKLVARIDRLGKDIAPRFAHCYYDTLTVGIGFTVRNLQRQSRVASNPWELCKGFDSSAVIGTSIPVERFVDVQNLRFHLDIDGNTARQGDAVDTLLKINDIIAYVSHFVILKIDDLLLAGTPMGVGLVSVGQHLEGYFEAERLLDFYIRQIRKFLYSPIKIVLMEIKVGFGFGVRQLVEGRKLWLGNTLLEHKKGLLGHSDADVLVHAICDALSGAVNMRDIGYHFPDDADEYENIDSKILLKRTVELITTREYQIGNIDATICAEHPKPKAHIPSIQQVLAEVTGIDTDNVSIKATTTEKLGFTGREEGISAYAAVLINRM